MGLLKDLGVIEGVGVLDLVLYTYSISFVIFLSYVCKSGIIALVILYLLSVLLVGLYLYKQPFVVVGIELFVVYDIIPPV